MASQLAQALGVQLLAEHIIYPLITQDMSLEAAVAVVRAVLVLTMAVAVVVQVVVQVVVSTKALPLPGQVGLSVVVGVTVPMALIILV